MIAKGSERSEGTLKQSFYKRKRCRGRIYATRKINLMGTGLINQTPIETFPDLGCVQTYRYRQKKQSNVFVILESVFFAQEVCLNLG